MKTKILFYVSFFLCSIHLFGQGQSAEYWCDMDETYVDEFFSGDFNGDNRADIVVRGTDNQLLLLKSHTAWNADESGIENKFVLQDASMGSQPTDGIYKKRLVGDFNGDGYDDIAFVKVINSAQKTESTKLPVGYLYQFEFDIRITKRDNVMRYTFSPMFSSGNKFTIPSGWTYVNAVAGDFFGPDGMVNGNYVKGDGLTDIAVQITDGSQYKWHFYTLQLKSGSSGTSYTYQIVQRTNLINFTPVYSNIVMSADFNGDGYDDIINYANNGIHSTTGFYVTYFDPVINKFAPRQSLYTPDLNIYQAQYVQIGDFNGDSYNDVMYYNGATWKIAYGSSGTLNSPVTWTSGQSAEYGVTSGDFDGDGFCDLAFLSSGQFKVALSQNNTEKKVGVFVFANFHYETDSVGNCIDQIGWYKNDASYRKLYGPVIPVTGWGADEKAGLFGYSYATPDAVDRIVKAIDKCGINFIVTGAYDLTTVKWRTSYSSNDIGSNYNGARNIYHAVADHKDSLSNLKHVAIGFGGHPFWGPHATEFYGVDSSSYHQKYQDQKQLFGFLNQDFLDADSSTFLKYLNKPLMTINTPDGKDFPFRDLADWRRTLPLWSNRNFTFRYVFDGNHLFIEEGGWIESYFANRWNPWTWEKGEGRRGWNYTPYASDNNHEPINKLLPPNVECMTITPGNTHYWTDNAPDTMAVRSYWRDGVKKYLYFEQWAQVLKVQPKMVIIGEWNNYCEMTGIESCYEEDTTNGYVGYWKDQFDRPDHDFYLEATRRYIKIYKEGSAGLENGWHFRFDNATKVYKVTNNGNIFQFNLEDADSTTCDESIIMVLPAGFVNVNNNTQDPVGTDKAGFSSGAYPNPFNPEVKISFNLPEKGKVKVDIFNILGERVVTLTNQNYEAGKHTVNWIPSYLSSGAYVYRINYMNQNYHGKIIYMK